MESHEGKFPSVFFSQTLVKSLLMVFVISLFAEVIKETISRFRYDANEH